MDAPFCRVFLNIVFRLLKLDKGASSLPKKLSWLSQYSVAIYFTDSFK